MRKSVNHLGCCCDLPSDLNQKEFICNGCLTEYERNPLVFRWYVRFTPTTPEEVIIANQRYLERTAGPSSNIGLVAG